MARKIFNLFLVLLIVKCAVSVDQNNNEKKDEKSIAKRGILHLNVHGHHHHVPAASPQVLVSPHVHHFVPKFPGVHHKSFVLPAAIPATPYHIHHGGATVTSFNVNYPRLPLVQRGIIPGILPPLHHHHLHHRHLVPHFHSFVPHHHHHSVFPHVHIAKPIIPIAVPNYPVFIPQKPIFIHSKPQFVPPSPTFLPIPIPAENPPTSSIPLSFNAGSDRIQNHNFTIQQQAHEIEMTATCPQHNYRPPPHNYHAHNLLNHQNDRKMTNHMFQVSGHGHQLAQHYSQQLIQEPQNSFPYPAAAETFSQDYELSNNGNYHGLNSYQVPIGSIQK